MQRLRQRQVASLWLPVVLWMGAIYALSSIGDLPHPESGWLDLILSGAAHVALYGVLAVLWSRALGLERRAMWIAFALSVAYGVTDELHQAFVPGRRPDAMDLLSDGLGAAAGLWVWSRLRGCAQGE